MPPRRHARMAPTQHSDRGRIIAHRILPHLWLHCKLHILVHLVSTGTTRQCLLHSIYQHVLRRIQARIGRIFLHSDV